MKFTDIKTEGYERVVKAEADDFLAFVSVHSTKLGVAMGGTRFMDFGSEEQQLADTNMLSESMTYKHALANTGMCGGKSTIALSKNPDTWKLFADTLNYVNKEDKIMMAAGDVGTGDKLKLIAEHTDFILGHTCDEPSGVATGYGVFQSLLGCYDFLGGSGTDARAYINGYGKVGSSFARFARTHIENNILFQDPNISVSDKNGKIGNYLDFEEILESCNVFAPCAMAHIVTPRVIDIMKPNSIIISGANNPEEDISVCRQAHDKGILFPPAWVSNAGGIIVIAESVNEPNASHSSPVVKEKLEAIRPLTKEILKRAKELNTTPMAVALIMAQEVLGK